MELRGTGSCSDDKGVETGVSRRGVSGAWWKSIFHVCLTTCRLSFSVPESATK